MKRVLIVTAALLLGFVAGWATETYTAISVGPLNIGIVYGNGTVVLDKSVTDAIAKQCHVKGDRLVCP